MHKVWSERPAKAYSVSCNGKQIGIGMREIWDQVPGAWNILQLLWGEQVEELLTFKEDVKDFPFDCGFVAYAVCMALERHSPEKTWGEIAAEVSPAKFVEMLKVHPDCEKFVLPLMFNHVFWDRATKKSAKYTELADNVIKVSFGTRSQ